MDSNHFSVFMSNINDCFNEEILLEKEFNASRLHQLLNRLEDKTVAIRILKKSSLRSNIIILIDYLIRHNMILNALETESLHHFMDIIFERSSGLDYKISNWVLNNSTNPGQLLYTLSTLPKDFQSECRKIVYNYLLKITPSPADIVQSLAIEKLRELLLTQQDLEDFADLIMSRQYYFWVEKIEVYDDKLVSILINVFQKCKNPLLFRLGLVYSCLILIENPVYVPVLDLLDICSQHLISLNDPITKYSMLPCVSGISTLKKSKSLDYLKISLKYRKILNSVEVMGETRVRSLELRNNDFCKIPHYHLFQCSYKDVVNQVILNHFPILKALDFGANIINNSCDNGIFATFCKEISSYRNEEKLNLLSLFIYLLNRKENAQLIMTKCIPSLANTRDLILASSCTKFILIALNFDSTPNLLQIVALESITIIWEMKSSIWPQIKLYFSKWANNLISAQIVPDDLKQKLNDIISKSINYFCFKSPSICGKDLFPLIVSLLNLSPKQRQPKMLLLSDIGYDSIFTSFNICVSFNIISIPRGIKVHNSSLGVSIEAKLHTLNHYIGYIWP